MPARKHVAGQSFNDVPRMLTLSIGVKHHDAPRFETAHHMVQNLFSRETRIWIARCNVPLDKSKTKGLDDLYGHVIEFPVGGTE